MREFVLLLGLSASASCGFETPGAAVVGGSDAASTDGRGDAPIDSSKPPADAFVPFVARYNIAGAAVTGTDYPGVWAADPGSGGICTGSYGPPTAAANISGTVDDALFVKQVYGLPTFTCAIAVPPGNYQVTLLFGPVYYGTGATPGCMFPRAQIFDISLEGQVVAAAYNLTAATGGCVANGGAGSHPVTQVFTVAVTDGTLNLSETAPAGEAAMLSAIQVIKVP